MDIFIPILTSTAKILVGRYRLAFTFNNANQELPDITSPRSISIMGKSMILEKTVIDRANLKYYVYIELKENPVPIMALVIGVLIILGLSLIYLTFSSIEKIVETSPTTVAAVSIAGLLLIGFLTTKKFL
jgi:hypothetical protein